MGESSTEQCRVEVEGPRVVNFFSGEEAMKSAVKSSGSTLDGGGKRSSEYGRGRGISGGAVKCVEIGKNTNDESTRRADTRHRKTKARGANVIRYPKVVLAVNDGY
ncbi:hypothetical protein Scep_020157 [Stephania cephalantha]|uniref:Uncharacterized protein n=1 Tax=Stephania cephalantha TaxID=152367 RepID=A0AAP0ICL7_9MAGN